MIGLSRHLTLLMKRVLPIGSLALAALLWSEWRTGALAEFCDEFNPQCNCADEDICITGTTCLTTGLVGVCVRSDGCTSHAECEPGSCEQIFGPEEPAVCVYDSSDGGGTTGGDGGTTGGDGGTPSGGGDTPPPSSTPPPPPQPSRTSSMGGQTADRNSSSHQEGIISGDPINNTTGNLFLIETDYVGAGPFPMVFRRTYNSQANTKGTFGANWSHSYSAHIRIVRSFFRLEVGAEVIRADQKPVIFASRMASQIPIAYVYVSSPDTNSTLMRMTDPSGNFLGWRYTTGSDEVELYDVEGRLINITTRAGLKQGLQYDDQGRLASVTDHFGRRLVFGYDASDRITTLTDPAGKVYRYEYHGDNLRFVIGPDGQRREYLYERSSMPHALTGVIDEDGVHSATFGYDDSSGRANSSEGAGGVDKVSIDYGCSPGSFVSCVTDALGTIRGFFYKTVFGVARTTGGVKNTINAFSHYTFDKNGNIDSYRDYRGHDTKFVYDLARNLETNRTEAIGTPEQRTITTQWHPKFRLPTEIRTIVGEETKRVIVFVYDDTNGNLLKRTVGEGGKTQTWTFEYDKGQIKKIDGPRTDVDDVTRYEYDDQTGNLVREIKALGHTTEFRKYDENGRPREIVDPNGVVTALTYDERGRLASREIEGELIAYNLLGQIQVVSRSDDDFVRFGYDAAHRLNTITDNLGNTIKYTRERGNLHEEVFDPEEKLSRIHSQCTDPLSRLGRSVSAGEDPAIPLEERCPKEQQEQSPALSAAHYTYDANDNMIQIVDPRGSITKRSYDALDRLTDGVDPKKAKTHFEYNASDQVTKIEDALSHDTIYEYDGVGNRLSTTSPDAGLMLYQPDAAGNVGVITDARNEETSYRYDALNRVEQIKFSGGVVTFTYDHATDTCQDATENTIGRLVEMTDSHGVSCWTYDVRGGVVRRTLQVGKQVFGVAYSYSPSGRLDAITYPSGKRIELIYDEGQVTEIKVDGMVLLHGIEYQPFGPPRAWFWGNGTPYSRQFDLDGRVKSYDLGAGRTRELIYDLAGRITDYIDTDLNRSQKFLYDNTGALTQFPSGGFGLVLEYDTNGNRTHMTGDQVIDYDYDLDSNRLVSITGTDPKTYEYDSAGNVTSDGTTTFEYDGRGRLFRVLNAQSGATEYQVNGLGQRVAKVGIHGTTYFVYDEAGRLLGEYDSQGNVIQETVYLGNMPVAVLTERGPLFIYTDHLGTPRAITNTSDRVGWRWEGDPFGAIPPDQDPDGDGIPFIYNLRFPGQYFDEETELAYNQFRYYDPQTGRYIQPDPIGLEGGMNPYSYVGGNPLSDYDFHGLTGLNGGPYIKDDGRRSGPFDNLGPEYTLTLISYDLAGCITSSYGGYGPKKCKSFITGEEGFSFKSPVWGPVSLTLGKGKFKVAVTVISGPAKLYGVSPGVDLLDQSISVGVRVLSFELQPSIQVSKNLSQTIGNWLNLYTQAIYRLYGVP